MKTITRLEDLQPDPHNANQRGTPNDPYQPHPACPTCGRCPTCGVLAPTPRPPVITSPVITWGTGTGSAPAQT